MLGQTQPQQGPNPEDQMRTVMMKIRDIQMDIEGVARQFPEFAPHARKVMAALMEGMREIVGKIRGPESQPTPQMLG